MKNKVLIIDDDPDIRESMQIILEGEGIEVLTAADGEVGYEVAHSERPDLILLDIIMDTQDEGFQCSYKLMSDPELKNTPVVVVSSISQVTGFTFDEDKDEDFLPVAEFVQKPISPSELVNIVRKYLGN